MGPAVFQAHGCWWWPETNSSQKKGGLRMDGLGGQSLSLMLFGGKKSLRNFKPHIMDFRKSEHESTTKFHGDMNLRLEELCFRRFSSIYAEIPSRMFFCFPFHVELFFFRFLLPGLLWTSFFPLDLGVVWKIHTMVRWKLMKGAGRHQHFPTIREVQPDSCLFVHLDELIQQ